MHAAVPLFTIDARDHDTQPDRDREELGRRIARRVRRETVEKRGPRAVEALENTNLPPKQPLSNAEQLAPGRVARVQIREALVKRMRPASAPKHETFRGVPDVPIAWLRSNDRGLKLSREGAGGFRIDGIARENGRIALGLEGLIFSIPIAAGDAPLAILNRLAARLEPVYALELLEQTPVSVSARLTER